MSEVVKVGMADIKIAKAPDSLTTIGLGSCVGVIIYDPYMKIAGLAHIMLPYAGETQKEFNIAKYADTAIPKVIEDMKNLGCDKSRLKSKIAGGSQMFAFQQDNSILKIGERNIVACKEYLKKYNIPIISEDVGGHKGRTIVFDIETEILSIKIIGSGVKEI